MLSSPEMSIDEFEGTYVAKIFGRDRYYLWNLVLSDRRPAELDGVAGVVQVALLGSDVVVDEVEGELRPHGVASPGDVDRGLGAPGSAFTLPVGGTCNNLKMKRQQKSMTFRTLFP